MSATCTIDEQLLIKQIKDGHQPSFRLLFDSYYRILHAYALKFVDPDRANDVVQDLFSNIWERRSDLVIKTSLHNYLFTGIRNNCLQLLEKQKVRTRYHQDKENQLALDELNYFHSETSQSLLEVELQNKIEEAISKLPEQCQKVFRLSRIKQVRNAEIAEQLQISPKTVEKHLSKALKIMREELKDYLPFLLLLLK
ncbi:RNA polymerase sigma-70 factor [Carboxylicivirga sp. RSCT41]|uniref:RNA polymerase sigma-70 factor n=1 Tax=Carboxylicivirga agarovorans TaxID=3417570 RepID=UPI003D33770F